MAFAIADQQSANKSYSPETYPREFLKHERQMQASIRKAVATRVMHRVGSPPIIQRLLRRPSGRSCMTSTKGGRGQVFVVGMGLIARLKQRQGFLITQDRYHGGDIRVLARTCTIKTKKLFSLTYLWLSEKLRTCTGTTTHCAG